MNEKRIAVIAALSGVPADTVREIIDPEYTYWSQRGDSTREEHMEFLVGPDQRIADWVGSIYREWCGDRPEDRKAAPARPSRTKTPTAWGRSPCPANLKGNPMTTKAKFASAPPNSDAATESKALTVRVDYFARNLVVAPQTPVEAASAVAQRNELKHLAKELEITKKRITKPINVALAEIRTLFKPVERKLDAAIDKLTAGLEEFHRQAQQALEVKKDRLETRVEDGEITQEKASRVLAKTIVNVGAAVVPVRQVRTVVVFDESLVPDAYRILDMVKIKVDAMAGKNIPGVRVDLVDQVYAT